MATMRTSRATCPFCVSTAVLIGLLCLPGCVAETVSPPPRAGSGQGMDLYILRHAETPGLGAKYADPALLDAVVPLEGLGVEGLMTMAPLVDDAEATRPVFAALRELRDAARARTGLPLAHLSMGMTQDFEVAIEEGATIVRVGRAIFGERG